MFMLRKHEKEIIDAFFLRYPCRFWVYGSRVKGTGQLSSDLDVCILDPISDDLYITIKTQALELSLPFCVEVVLWRRLMPTFQACIERDLVLYKIDPWLGAHLVDLTHEITHQIPSWDGNACYEVATLTTHENIFYKQEVRMINPGTHLDAPFHVIPDGAKTHEVNHSDNIIAPCSIMYADESSMVITAQHILDFEDQYGRIEPHSWFVIMTGWGKYWYDADLYAQRNEQGMPVFPSLTVDAVDLLVKYNVKGIALDMLSPEDGPRGMQTSWYAHKRLLSSGILIIENIRYIPNIPTAHGFLMVVGLPMVGLSEASVRVLLLHR